VRKARKRLRVGRTLIGGLGAIVFVATSGGAAVAGTTGPSSTGDAVGGASIATTTTTNTATCVQLNDNSAPPAPPPPEEGPPPPPPVGGTQVVSNSSFSCGTPTTTSSPATSRHARRRRPHLSTYSGRRSATAVPAVQHASPVTALHTRRLTTASPERVAVTRPPDCACDSLHARGARLRRASHSVDQRHPPELRSTRQGGGHPPGVATSHASVRNHVVKVTRT